MANTGGMDHRGGPSDGTELGDFLRARRAALDPGRAGIPDDGRLRRVPGLRREELAQLAHVSTDYVVRLEQFVKTLPSLSRCRPLRRRHQRAVLLPPVELESRR